MTSPVLPLAEALIACPSVTPAAGLVFDCLEGQLAPLGFEVHRFQAGEAPDGPVENLFAIRKGPEGSRHFGFAGHVDDMAAAFLAAHVTVIASTEPEAFGRTATEN